MKNKIEDKGRRGKMRKWNEEKEQGETRSRNEE